MAENTYVSQHPLPPLRLYKDGALKSEPPQPPKDETYAMFGTTYSMEERLPSLEEAGRKVLYDPQKKRTEELKRLNKLLLHTFLGLVQSLCSEPDPDAYREKVEEVEEILLNMHHLINTLRPDQAHQNIMRLLEKLAKLRREATATLRQALEDSQKVLDNARTMLQTSAENNFTAIDPATFTSTIAALHQKDNDKDKETNEKAMLAEAKQIRMEEEDALVKEELERIGQDSM
eukprot:Plantae.Rhodophyta-Purpureofilum_apyrenoidigerum.ctg4927.p1 GENE.Plantae.Rhodophyta-Purpureofilum_apyrenoidigerum.ctg4927~~Plantae.Rhodophyta-Purpureofilum_apyrenoidigerum.ctg4927.p1  ORF type:complete len:232 (-),score=60.91 Plantae.Rhodophyta-Purpureofilum_apyrenoidigerum.ctg4927:1163-1858(-)